MAKSDAVWAIDIGQCALKALRCRPHDDPTLVQALAFDFIEYPKVLSQPDADPVALVADALRQFLSRNSVRGDKVFITVPGQNGLARFIKLPPVEIKKIPDIVKYEAKQQIPFPLEEVVYRHQRMAGGSIVEGFAMETEVGLFAMKRDQAYRALKPFQEAGIAVDCIQLTPLALYNFVAFDQMPDLPAAEDYDPDNPPDSVVLLSLGTDTADLVVTNGFRVWQRSLPIGGNHFTKALTKELKLTYASAELQKRNALNSEDTKTLFQAMRPVFNDLLTELTRSINYFTNLDKKARVKRGLALGNAMKLPGLQRYLAQNLGFDLERVEAFRGLVGPAVVEAPVFKENLLAFGPCYGLAIQALRKPKVDVNLVPDEIRNDRIVRAKKPWMVGAAAALLVGVTLNFASHYRAVASVRTKDSAGKSDYFGPALDKAKAVVKDADANATAYKNAVKKYEQTDIVGSTLLVTAEGRRRWLEILKAINACLPHDPVRLSKPPEDRVEVYITSIESAYTDKVEDWYSASTAEIAVVAQANAPAPKEGETAPAATPAAAPPTGPGWIIRVTGYHLHNKDAKESFIAFANNRFATNFLKPEIEISVVDAQNQPIVEKVPVQKIGIKYPALINLGQNDKFKIEIDDELEGKSADGKKENGKADDEVAPTSAKSLAASKDEVPSREVVRLNFAVEFLWLEPPKPAADAATTNASSSAPASAASTPAATGATAPASDTSKQAPPNGSQANGASPTSAPAEGGPPAEGPQPPSDSKNAEPPPPDAAATKEPAADAAPPPQPQDNPATPPASP